MNSHDPALFDLVLKHHLAHRDFWKATYTATPEFLDAAAKKSPNPRNRGWALGKLARWYQEQSRPTEAIAVCDRMTADAAVAEETGWLDGTWGQWATRKKFELEHLQVGKSPPNYQGVGLDGEPMALAGSAGKVTLIVFWATWCAPCMAMIPHERALHKQYAGRPFAIVGVNGDDTLSQGYVKGDDGKLVKIADEGKARVAKVQMPWRSFASSHQKGLPGDWCVQTWPTVYLLDHKGVIRRVWQGTPEDAELDGAIGVLVKAAEEK